MQPRYADRPDLPLPLLNALRDEYYSEGLTEHFERMGPEVRNKFKHHFSATTLPRAPRQRILTNRHIHKVIVNPLDGFWKLLGHIVHLILQKHAAEGDTVEERMGRVIDVEIPTGITRDVKLVPVYIHGQLDRYVAKEQLLQDWKLTSAESMLYEDKAEYHAQLNILAWIGRGHKRKIKLLQNVYLFRNWMRRNVKEGTLYPQEQCQLTDVPIWSDEKVEKYIKLRAAAHIQSESLEDDKLPHCTDEERWKGISLYKVYKIDLKKNDMGFAEEVRQQKSKYKDYSKLACTEWMDAPENKVNAKGVPNKYEIVEIPAKPVRCTFCEISKMCNQRNAEIAQELSDMEQEDED